MAELHATEDLRNVERTAMVHLCGAGLGTVVPSGDETFNSATVDTFVRVSFQPLPEQRAGRVVDSGVRRHAVRASLLCVCECMAQGTGTGGGSVTDAVQGLASRVAGALRYRSLPIADYVTDPSGATPTVAALRFDKPPYIKQLPASEGWQRRIVTAEGHWFLRHSEA